MPVKMIRQDDGGSGTEDHAPHALLRFQTAAGQCDHQRVVAGQQNVDPDDLADGYPECGLLHFDLKLNENRLDRRRIENMQQPVHSAPLCLFVLIGKVGAPPRADRSSIRLEV